MNLDPRQILATCSREYLAINQSFLILEKSSGASRFADRPEEVRVGEDVRLGFPELVGLEEIFGNIFAGQEVSFSLKEICRSCLPNSPIYFNLYLVLDRDIEKQEKQLIIIVEDVTERLIKDQKIVQAANEYSLLANRLAATKSYLQQVIISLKDALLITNSSGKIKTVNPATVKLFGYSEEELLAHNFSILLPSSNFSSLINQENIEIICKRKTGEKLYVVFSSAAIELDKENSPDFVFIGRDLTERKQVELRLRQQGKRDRCLASVARQIRQSFNLEDIFHTITCEARQILECDRILVYRCQQVKIVAESVADGYHSLLGSSIDHAACQQEQISIIENIHTQKLERWDFERLTQLQVQAELAVPISSNNPELEDNLLASEGQHLNQFWGLLVAHQCQAPRQWQQWEIDLLKQLTEYLAIAIQQTELYQQLKELAIIDGLTKLANRRYFNHYLNKEWKRLAREQKPLSLILWDVDHFKIYNDNYGHLAGDSCLQQLASILRKTGKRPADLAARYGGEEFALILPNTNIEGALYLAEQIQSQIKALKIPHSYSSVSKYVTVSLGVASTIPKPASTPEKLIKAADVALYRAKEQGRDRTVAASDPI